MISYNRLGSRHTQTLQSIQNDDVLKDDGKTSCVGNIEHTQTVSSLQLQMVPAGHDVQFLYTPMLYSCNKSKSLKCLNVLLEYFNIISGHNICDWICKKGLIHSSNFVKIIN